MTCRTSFGSARRVEQRRGEATIFDRDLLLADVERDETLAYITHVRDDRDVDDTVVVGKRRHVVGRGLRQRAGAAGHCGRDAGRGRDRRRSLEKLSSTRRFHLFPPSVRRAQDLRSGEALWMSSRDLLRIQEQRGSQNPAIESDANT